MKYNRNRFGIVIIAMFILGLITPDVSSANIVDVSTEIEFASSSYSGNVTGVPYVWQEINGFCHWAAYSMIIQSAGVPLDMYSLFAATGIGFSASYLRYETNMLFFPGPFYIQTVSTMAVEDIFGLNITMYLDPTSSDDSSVFAELLGILDVEFTEITGFDEAFAVLKNTIDSGYPIEIWTDPYYLPVSDYDVFRDLGIHYEDTSSGHAVVVVGYNETAGTVQVLDPGVGAFGNVGFPDDGRYSYEMNLTQLENTWSSLFYGSFTVKPGEGPSEDFTSKLGTHILERMCGVRTSYVPEMEDVFYWILGSDSFRGLAYDLTSTGLSSYIDEFGVLSSLDMNYILKALGQITEGFLSIQHLSFRTALEALPEMLPDLNLDEFVTAGREALEHFELLSDNSTMTSFSYDGGATITTDTFNEIAHLAYTQSGNLESAVTENEENLDVIRNHLFAIADAWDAAANALDFALNEVSTTTFVVIIVCMAGFVSVVSAAAYVRRKA
ncbi:MAG: BtrH N-terminal domain-containing protein [Candidatus Thorarchaeota archaeon]